jgi:hypothetical protein
MFPVRNNLAIRFAIRPMLLALLASQFACVAQKQAHQDSKLSAAPSITITLVPHAGTGGPDRTEPIKGLVKGVDFTNFKVVVYAFAGGTWWVQPTTAEPLTDIDDSGKWETDTHLGITYAVLLVKASFNAPATASTLPRVQADVIAVTREAGKD